MSLMLDKELLSMGFTEIERLNKSKPITSNKYFIFSLFLSDSLFHLNKFKQKKMCKYKFSISISEYLNRRQSTSIS
jgi:hypothetical protein